ncbi:MULTISPECIES: hypothetical protein [Sphingomonas]|uniref:hypothetical protein n=1 Tax=Sphingomonas TaxID=13687 RepID=UPI0013B37A29|nr:MULTISPECIES: hypothetical protein [Sphingomonas]
MIGLPLAAAAAAFSLAAAPVIETLPEAHWLSPFDYPIAITGPKVQGRLCFF